MCLDNVLDWFEEELFIILDQCVSIASNLVLLKDNKSTTAKNVKEVKYCMKHN